jgi:hypothetical protein
LKLFRDDRLDESLMSAGASAAIPLPAPLRAEAGVRYDLLYGRR